LGDSVPDDAPAARSEEARAKPYEPNAILRWLYARFFSHISVDERWSGAVRQAADRGVVVYVMRSISVLDFLCLDFLLKRFALPVVRFVNDLGLWILEPFGKGERRLRLRRQIPEGKALSDTVREHFSALLFLRKPPKLGQVKRKGRELEVDLIRTLVETQRQIDQPILLVPQTFVWSKLPSKKKPTFFDLFFGPVEWPGRVRVFFQFLLNFRNALLRTGEPFDLQAYIDDHQELTDGEIANQVRYALLRIMEREREVVLGPSKKTPGRIRDELLRSPRVRRHIEAQARATDKPVAKVEKQARKDLKKLGAAQNPYWLGLLHRLFDRVWNRIYDGIEVDREGLDRIRDASRQGSLVLLPRHRSLRHPCGHRSDQYRLRSRQARRHGEAGEMIGNRRPANQPHGSSRVGIVVVETGQVVVVVGGLVVDRQPFRLIVLVVSAVSKPGGFFEVDGGRELLFAG